MRHFLMGSQKYFNIYVIIFNMVNTDIETGFLLIDYVLNENEQMKTLCKIGVRNLLKNLRWTLTICLS